MAITVTTQLTSES